MMAGVNKDMVIAQLLIILVALIGWLGAYGIAELVELKDRVYELERTCQQQ